MKAKFNPNSLKELRKRETLTHDTLAKLLGCNIETVRSWEQGRSEPYGLYVEILYQRYILNKHRDIRLYE